jgi:SAM-dependent methyltransferase
MVVRDLSHPRVCHAYRVTGTDRTLPLTGERTAPGIWHENYWFARHEAAYHWIRPLVRGRVLDAGCGEGYGAAMLAAAGADRVHAVDYDPAAVAHVRRRYAGIPAVQGNLVQLGYAGASFDLVVSMQTIEHLWEQPRFVSECRRVLRPAGTLVLTTPNRLTFPAGNCYHTRELTAAELADLVAAEMTVDTLAGLIHGRRIVQWEMDHGLIVDAQLAAEPNDWPAELAVFVRSISWEDFEITAERPDDWLDLLLVANP